MKFKYKIIGSVGILVCLSLTSLAFMQYRAMRASVEQEMENSLAAVTTSVVSDLDHSIASKVNVAQYAIENMAADLGKKNVEQVLNKAVIKQEFQIAAVAFPNKKMFENNPNWDAPASFDPTSRPWYIAAKNTGKLVFTEPYVDTISKELLFSIASPTYNSSHQLAAVSIFDIKLSFLKNIIQNISFAAGAGKVFIVTNKEKIVYHPNNKYNGAELGKLAANIDIHAKGKKEVIIDNNNYLLGFIDMPDLDWKVGYYIDIDKMYAGVNKLGQSALVMGAVALIISLLLITLLTSVVMRPINILDNAMDNLNSGEADLTHRLATDGDYEFAQISKAFNDFIEKLQEQVGATISSAESIKKIANETSMYAADSHLAMGSQLKELEQLVTAMEQMSGTAGEVANNAQGVADATVMAQNATQEGEATVEHTLSIIRGLAVQINSAVEVIAELESSTNEIGTILNVINGVSDQTNLLALNAAIEAARAGEHGRGFAVVADEVRVLAQRTKDSTTEIQKMIGDLQEKSQAVVKIIDQSKDDVQESVTTAENSNIALSKIAQAIRTANDLILQIASAAEEQSSVACEINKNASNISQSTTKVTKLLENTSSEAEQELINVDRQEQIMQRFKV